MLIISIMHSYQTVVHKTESAIQYSNAIKKIIKTQKHFRVPKCPEKTWKRECQKKGSLVESGNPVVISLIDDIFFLQKNNQIYIFDVKMDCMYRNRISFALHGT